MLFRFWTCFWLRLASWLEQMLCLDSSGIVLVWLQPYGWEHSAVVVKVSFLSSRLLLFVIRTSMEEVVSSPPCVCVSVCGATRNRTVDRPCVGVDMAAWVNTSWPNQSVLYCQEMMCSWLFDHQLIWDADVYFNNKLMFPSKTEKTTNILKTKADEIIQRVISLLLNGKS